MDLELHASKRTTVNRYAVSIFLKPDLVADKPEIKDVCLKITNLVSEADFTNINFETDDHICSYAGSQLVNPRYVKSAIKKANYLVILLNQRDGTLAGFAFGKIFMNTPSKVGPYYFDDEGLEHRYAALYVDVFCGHQLLKGVGSVLMNCLKCLTYYISEEDTTKLSLMLYSVPNRSTLAFYDHAEIIPYHTASTFNANGLQLREWSVPSSQAKMQSILNSFKQSSIKFKANGDSQVQHLATELELHSPRSLGLESPKDISLADLKTLIQASYIKVSDQDYFNTHIANDVLRVKTPSPRISPRVSPRKKFHRVGRSPRAIQSLKKAIYKGIPSMKPSSPRARSARQYSNASPKKSKSLKRVHSAPDMLKIRKSLKVPKKSKKQSPEENKFPSPLSDYSPKTNKKSKSKKSKGSLESISF